MENKRDNWSYDETLTLIIILKEKKILKIMDNKRFRIVEIFKFLEQDMTKKGYHRNATQIHIKFKALKRNYNNCRTALSKSGAGVMKKCTFYDELHELFGCRPVNIQKGLDSLNATSSIDVNMFDNIPDTDGAIPGCSTYSDEFNSSCINENENQLTNIDKSKIHRESDSIGENSDIIIDKEVEQQLESSISSEISSDNIEISHTKENNRNKDSKKRFKFTRSTKRQTFAQVFDDCVQKLIKSNEDNTRVSIQTQKDMMNDILKQQERMLQQQTQLLMHSLHANTSYSEVSKNYVSSPEQFRPPLHSFNNSHFVRVPLNAVDSSERYSPVTPPPIIPFSTASPISTISPTIYNTSSASTSLQSSKNPRFVRVPLNAFQSSEKCLPVIATAPLIPSSTLPIVPFSTSSPISITSTTCNLSSTSTSSQVLK